MFGLDNLKCHQCCIDLVSNNLHIKNGEISVPFRADGEIKKKEIITAKSEELKQVAKATKIIKETKKENKPSSEEKPLVRKTAIVNLEKPKGEKKNKSSTERSK